MDTTFSFIRQSYFVGRAHGIARTRWNRARAMNETSGRLSIPTVGLPEGMYYYAAGKGLYGKISIQH